MTRLFGLCLLLLGATALAGVAGPILINATTQGQQLLIDGSIKDGDLVQALTTLFNKVGFQVQIGQNVTGTIPNLQFTREPFESALKKILASADGTLQFEKVDEDSYRIRRGDGGALPALPLKAPDDAAVTAPVDDIKIIKVMLPKLKKINNDGTVAETTTTPATGTTEEEEAAETEECFIGLFTVYNLQLEGLCMMFGDEIAQYVPTQMINYGNMMNNNGDGNSNGFNNSSWGNNNSSWGNNNNGWGNNNNNNNWNSGYNNNNNNGYNNYNNNYNNNNNGYYR